MLKKTGLIYKSPFIYSCLMKILYGKNYNARYKKVAGLINSAKGSLIDICCGDCKLYQFIKTNIDYVGLDISQEFINSGLVRNIKIRYLDIERNAIPKSDYILIQGSLYQFKKPEKIVEKSFNSARKKLIISEPVKNLTDNQFIRLIPNSILSLFLGTKNSYSRFNEKSLKELLYKYRPKYIKIPGGRDLIAIIEK